MSECKNIEILCATMHQYDFSKHDTMNIHDCDVVFANQADKFSYQEMTVGSNSVKMLTTATRGWEKTATWRWHWHQVKYCYLLMTI